MFRYEIDESTNAVNIFEGENELPIIFQPDWPDMTPWANKEEAESWAQQWILSREDDSADWPGSTPSQPTVPRVQAE
jgi:hypothetical protein